MASPLWKAVDLMPGRGRVTSPTWLMERERTSMKVITSTLGILAVILSMSSGCANRPTMEEIFEKRRQYEERYASGTMEDAGRCMREYLEYLLTLRELDIEGVNYCYLLGLIYGRLFAISELQGDEEAAAHFFEMGVYWYSQEVTTGRSESHELTLDELRRKIEAVDVFEHVRWRAAAADTRDYRDRERRASE